MVENGRVYYIHRRPLFCLPDRGKIRKKIGPIGSTIRYSIEKIHLPSMIRISLFEQTESLATKHVTSKSSKISPNNPFILTSPQWRPSLDEEHQDNLRQSINKLIHIPLSPIIPRNHLSRLSLRSIFYGFDLGTKTRNKHHLTSSPTYHLPANKFELDLNQQEIIRRTGSFKKSL